MTTAWRQGPARGVAIDRLAASAGDPGLRYPAGLRATTANSGSSVERGGRHG